jgi:hypothetical protein
MYFAVMIICVTAKTDADKTMTNRNLVAGIRVFLYKIYTIDMTEQADATARISVII